VRWFCALIFHLYDGTLKYKKGSFINRAVDRGLKNATAAMAGGTFRAAFEHRSYAWIILEEAAPTKNTATSYLPAAALFLISSFT